MAISRLEHRKVAVWGFGREGRAAVEVLRRRFPHQALTVIVPPDAIEEARRSSGLGDVDFVPDTALESTLCRFDIVVKSPGISPYRPEVLTAREEGVELTSGTALWFEEHAADRTLCITGTKGKSTTAALLAHLMRGVGLEVELVGNIGTPLLKLLQPETPPEFWVIELSSYQTYDFDGAPEVAVLLNLFPEHLDWHKSAENYYRDKLKIFAHPDVGTAVLNRRDARTTDLLSLIRCSKTFFNDPGGVHFEGGQLWDGETQLCSASDIPLPGEHNISNLCAALTVLKRLRIDLRSALESLASFEGLPHRLSTVGVKNGITYVDDSISTIPQSAVAAMRSYTGSPVCILVGGYDRGLDWRPFAEFVVENDVLAVITLPDSGPQIAEVVRQHERAGGTKGPSRVHPAKNLEEAVQVASTVTPAGGIVLLSPGAPSFGQFRDYEERGRAFSDLVAALPESG